MDRDKCLYFKRGYKYQVARPYHIKIAVIPFFPVNLAFVKLDMEGNLDILPGYAWDGASGPTWDTLNSIPGSLVHDVGYQLIRLGLIDKGHKEYFDQLLYDICVDDGMFAFRASYWRWAVLTFGEAATMPSSEPKEEVAP